MRRTAWVEVDYKAIEHNLKTIRKIINPSTSVIGIVKANAYGHGSFNVAKLLVKNKVEMLGVATLGEALELRENKIKSPVLILTPGFSSQAFDIVKHNIRQAVCTLEMAVELSKQARKQNKQAVVHIKVDTGLGRLGVLPDSALDFIRKVKSLKNILIEGIFTHFASADERDVSWSKHQLKIFMEILRGLKMNNIDIPVKHTACSAAVMKMPESHFNAVRPGLMLYGILPYLGFSSDIKLKPAMSLKTRVIFIKDVEKGTSIGYGRSFFTGKKSKIAILGIGYADGYSRNLSNKGEVIINGKKAPILGRVCMDLTMADVSNVRNVKIGDEVILFGSDGKLKISAEEIANKIGTIPYDIICMVNSHLQRIAK